MNGLGSERSLDLKQIADNSIVCIFGNDVVEEVELGGLEDELPVAAIEEDFVFDKEEVEVSTALSDVDDLASTFPKLHSDPDGYRSKVAIADNGSRQSDDAVHHGTPQLTGNMPQFRPSLPVNNHPPAKICILRIVLGS